MLRRDVLIRWHQALPMITVSDFPKDIAERHNIRDCWRRLGAQNSISEAGWKAQETSETCEC